jgi:hypothetical protein
MLGQNTAALTGERDLPRANTMPGYARHSVSPSKTSLFQQLARSTIRLGQRFLKRRQRFAANGSDMAQEMNSCVIFDFGELLLGLGVYTALLAV